MANSAWREHFPLLRVINGDPRHSDHRPIIIEPGDSERGHWRKPLEIMKKFEARWLEEDDCSIRVEEAWEKALGDGDVCLMEIQNRMLRELWEWDHNVLGALAKCIKIATKELEQCHQSPISEEQINREHFLKYKLECLLDQHHVYCQ